MKNLFLRIMLLLLLGATLLRCSEDEQTPAGENVAVTFSFTAEAAANGRVKAETPDLLYLSLTKSTGEPVLTYQKVKILSVGESYISEPVSLPAGSYLISDFLLADKASDSVLFAAPKKGSALAKFVSRPLPYAFSVAKDKISNVAMEVIDVSTASPEDFGYVAFQINPVNPLSLSVFVQTASNTQLVTARAFLLTGDDTTKVYELGAKVNAIGIPGDPHIVHTLVVVKQGYTFYTQAFKYSDLASKSITALLSPAFTIAVSVETPSQPFEFYATGARGTIHVDWGDGTVESHPLESNPIGHTYATEGNYFINITGDLDEVINLTMGGIPIANPILYVDLYRLTEVGYFAIAFPGRGLKVLDMSKNTKLGYVFIGDIPTLENFIIPEQNSIDNIFLRGLERITTPVIDDAINKVYNSAILEGRLAGNFELIKGEFGSAEPIGPPSPSAIAKLIDLRDNYGWSVTPLP